jgi:hypothetical protein
LNGVGDLFTESREGRGNIWVVLIVMIIILRIYAISMFFLQFLDVVVDW